MVRAILTDAMDVLFHGLTDLAKIAKAIDKDKSTNEEFYVRYVDRHLEDFWELCRGNISEIDFCKQRNDAARDLSSLARKCLLRALRINMRRRIKGTFEIYQELMAKYDVQLFLASDHIAEFVPQLIEWHPEVFDAIPRLKRFWSCDIGFVKRDPEFFPYVFSIMENNFGIPKDDVLVVDDNETTIDSLRAQGVNAIHYKRERFDKDLERYGLVA